MASTRDRRKIEARPTVCSLTPSRIREIANAGFGKPDVLRLWFGESDQPTPAFIRDAGIQALTEGKTFYAHNQGVAELRQALSSYLGQLHGRSFDVERLCITSSGVSALMLAAQALLEPGDRVVVVTPVWPNVTEIPRILNAQVERVALSPVAGEWRLDLDRLLDAITPDTRLVIVNSPGNPTGWTLSAAQQAALLKHCRRLGTWLLTDDVYERLILDETLPVAPSFLRMTDPEDRVISANSFSKAWLMTGWRLGWLVTPPELSDELAKLIEYNTSCAPEFVQAAGIVALRDGESHVAKLRSELIAKRDLLLRRLRALPGVEATLPRGGMYVLLRLAGHTDSMKLARQLIAEAGLGLAPGIAFGPEAEGWLRCCFAVADTSLDDAADRLGRWLTSR
jgi:aspartate/methionine/tyrosine aminotransferase